MKRSTIIKIVGVAFLATAVVTLVVWDTIAEAYGPMEQHEACCLICHRERVRKWVCGSKVRDGIVTNKYSEWIDSFTPSDHEHVWVGHSSYHRSRWFGPTSVACGGIATIPRIFDNRMDLGESRSQQLASRFHELVRQQSPNTDFSELYRFENAVVENPASLLELE